MLSMALLGLLVRSDGAICIEVAGRVEGTHASFIRVLPRSPPLSKWIIFGLLLDKALLSKWIHLRWRCHRGLTSRRRMLSLFKLDLCRSRITVLLRS
jgi:hypothetical protein